MSAFRNLIRRWLGVPTREEIRSTILREIGADAVWRAGSMAHRTFDYQRDEKKRDREVAIMMGDREDILPWLDDTAHHSTSGNSTSPTM